MSSNKLLNSFAQYSYRTRILWVICCILIGSYFVCVIPINTQLPSRHKLIIIATGKREPRAQGSEVWLHSIGRTKAQELTNESTLSLGPGWTVRNDALLSYQDQPAKLVYKGLFSENVTLVFGSHPWSGKVNVIWDGNKQTLDLFSETLTTKSVTLPIHPTNLSLQITIIIVAIIVLSFLSFILSLWLITRPSKDNKPVKPSRLSWVWYSLPFIAVWSFYLLAYWPGGMSPDSLDQWNQMLTFRFIDWHPVFHTLTNWLITRVWLSPAAVALAQIITLSIVLGWGLNVLRAFGAPKWLPWFTILIIVLMPSTGLMVIVLWKDIFFSVWVVALTILVFEITMTGGQWIQGRFAWVYLGIVTALIALYRQNGPLASFGTLLCLLIAYRNMWKRLILAALLALIIWMGVRGPIYNLVGAQKTSISGTEMILAHILARYTNEDVPLSREEQSLLRTIRPEKIWPYDCYMESSLYFDGKFHYTDSVNRELGILTIKLIYRNPKVFLDHLRCNGAFIYQITRPANSAYETTVPYIVPNQLGLISASKLPLVKTIIDRWEEKSLQTFDWLFWRAPLWCYLLMAGVTMYWIRSKNWKVILVLAPVLANNLPLAIIAAGQGFRYVFLTLLIGVLMSFYFIYISVAQDIRVGKQKFQ